MRIATSATLAFLLAAPGLVQAQTAPPSTGPGVSATTSNPNLAVATIKLDNGVRISKIIGASVFGANNQDLGKIDDLVMTKGDEITLAVVSVGGFMGVGSKLVAFAYKDLKQEGDRITLPGVTPEALNAMPSFEY